MAKESAVSDFEDLFKSEKQIGKKCASCGHTLEKSEEPEEDIDESDEVDEVDEVDDEDADEYEVGKSAAKGSAKVERITVGNSKAPHRGAASGQVNHPRGGGLKGKVNMGASPMNPIEKNTTNKKKKKGTMKSLFPLNKSFSPVEYVGTGMDTVIAKGIENGQFFEAPLRNARLDREAHLRKSGDVNENAEVDEEVSEDDDSSAE